MGPGANRGGAVTLPAELDGVVSAYRAAVLAADADALMGLYSDDARVFDAWDRWEYLGSGQGRVAHEHTSAPVGGHDGRAILSRPAAP